MPRLLVVSLLSLMWGGAVAHADITVIYRKADQVIAGYVYPGQPYELELENILRSELGGKPEDYASTTVPRLNESQVLTINPDGTAKETPRPTEDDREIPLSDVLAGGGAIAGAASLVLVARRKKAGT